MDDAPPDQADGTIPTAERLADIAAIEALAIAYAHAVDDRDWTRWEALFEPDGFVDYRAAGGIAGTPAEVARWMPDAMAVFTFCQHSISTHEIRFTGSDRAEGRVHVFNRNGVEWEGEAELVDVGAGVPRHLRPPRRPLDHRPSDRAHPVRDRWSLRRGRPVPHAERPRSLLTALHAIRDQLLVHQKES